ncbi:HNH endonuclease [Nocardioides sp. cx-169]|uniref:HNH endonuclease n=1 Tax=Nocardioides sp. cx-169 TaxID=2899080 RepID=UPI001E4BB74E|nr:HNH endonuclease signature motif containing protein [Nocardioides sp. cx-169]MCD4534362.1 HNH endonuclease [Nocardioides sp. cx-169]
MIESPAEQVRRWVAHLATLSRDLPDDHRIDLIGALEDLKCGAAGAQAVATVDLDASQRQAQEERGLPTARIGEGIASQIGLARRESPHKAGRLLGLAKILQAEMPHTLDRLRAGELSEWRATILVRETACLSLDDRQEVDRRLCCPEGPALTMSDASLEGAARKLAADLDNAAVAARARKAEADRHVGVRPAPDTMVWVRALLPVKQGVAVFAALKAAADAAQAAGDPRSRGQVMADTLYERVTSAGAADPVQVHLDLVMTDRTFFHSGSEDDRAAEESAQVPGYGPVPADWAHDLLADSLSAEAVWVRRLYTHPDTGDLVAMDSRARRASAGLEHFIRRRDHDVCRTPWCGAPIRHVDHATEWQSGGPTCAINLQGLCERCNHAKQAPGWHARPSPADDYDRHIISITTPTGHTYRSRAPSPLGQVDIRHVKKAVVYELVV